jgi:transcriptional regulator GlxA family with amidase domain
VRIAIGLFEDAEELDFAGPWEVLSYWAGEVARADVEVVTVAATLDPIRAAKGLRVLPDHTLPDSGLLEVGPVDVFLLPGGKGTRRLLGPDEPLHVALRAMAEAGVLMTSVCTGALVYAAAGLLRGRPATTYWSAFDELLALDPTISPRPDERFVDDGDVITAAGVSAGIDMALHLVRRLDSADAARQVRRGIQYDPQPPV